SRGSLLICRSTRVPRQFLPCARPEERPLTSHRRGEARPSARSVKRRLMRGDDGVGHRGFVPLQRQQLLPVDRNVARGFDAQTNLASVDVHDRDADIIADVDLLTEFPTEDQHLATLLRAKQWLTCTDILCHES